MGSPGKEPGRPRSLRARSGLSSHLWRALPLLFIVACGDPAEPAPEPNRPPASVGTIPDVVLSRGSTATVDVSEYFNDPEGATLQYEAATSNGTVVSVSTSGAAVSMAALSVGQVLVIVTALDPGGLAAQQAFAVAVPAPPLVDLAARAAAAPEGDTVVVELMLSSAPPTQIEVGYVIGVDGDLGTLDADSADFTEGLVGKVAIPAGSLEAAIALALNDDDEIEPTREVFTITLVAPPFDAGYDLGTETSAVGTILEGVCDRTPAVRTEIVTQARANDCSTVADDHLSTIVSLELGGRGSNALTLPIFDGSRIVPCDIDEWLSTDDLGGLRQAGEEGLCEAGLAAAQTTPALANRRTGGALETLKAGDFQGLSNLGLLSITNAGLSHLPPGLFSGLRNLRFLVLLGNQLTELPEDAFSDMPDLSFLVLANNRLTALPDGITGLANLNSLVLSSNRLTELPDSLFTGLSSLETVFLDDNRLARLPAGGPVGVANLVLTSNQLTELPSGWLAGASGLLRLYLANNQFTELAPDAFAGLSSLLELHLSGNGLREMEPGVLSDLSSLRELRLFQNQLTELPAGAFAGVENLTRLLLGQNQLSALSPGVFSGLDSLEWLAVDRNPIGELAADAFAGLPRLERLWLSDIGLAQLPLGVFAGLSELEFLALAVNDLTELSADVFAGLTSITTLYLLENQLSELPDGLFGGLPNLERLYLSDNALTELPTGVFAGLSSLLRLSLEDNPGAPFTLMIEVDRLDNEDLLAPSPGEVGISLAHGAPFTMRIPLAVHGGGPPSTAAVLGVGEQHSPAVTVTRNNTTGGGTQVSAGPAPDIPTTVTGVRVAVSDPLVLFGTVSNQAPVPLLQIPWYRLRGGEEAQSVDLRPHFRDPDGDELRYELTNENPDVAIATVAGDSIVLTPQAGGSTLIGVTASDSRGLSASLDFPVSVRAPVTGLFDMDVILINDVTELQSQAFEDAADWWMSILADTELPDVPLDGQARLGCGDTFTEEEIGGSIDDLVVVASVEEIDGPGGILAGARPCSVREGSMLPFLGIVRFDKDDLANIEGTRDLEELILHEIGHVLGIGSLWAEFDLLRDPSLVTPGADTHFAGPLAVAAFDEAGGTAYEDGAKVPVENRAGPGSGDSHWRQSVFVTEVMTPFASIGTPDPLSAITLQSLADLGYTVDVSLAEPYTLPGLVAAAELTEAIKLMDLGEDVLRGPVAVVDRDGRVVRVIER